MKNDHHDDPARREDYDQQKNLECHKWQPKASTSSVGHSRSRCQSLNQHQYQLQQQQYQLTSHNEEEVQSQEDLPSEVSSSQSMPYSQWLEQREDSRLLIPVDDAHRLSTYSLEELEGITASPSDNFVKDTMAQIESIKTKMGEVRERIKVFNGGSNDPEFLYLEEMMIRAIVALDDLETRGDKDIRHHRKNLIKYIQYLQTELDKKARKVSVISADDR